MRILFAAKHPPIGGTAFGGVASWILTLSNELRARGHECVWWGYKSPDPEGRFDVGVFSNVKKTAKAMQWCERNLVVSHGIIPDEKPERGQRILFTSEEVRAHWGGDGPILRQPIDLEFWRDAGKRRSDFVFYSYRAKSTFGLDALARRLGLNFVRLKDVSAEVARNHLQSAALVAASGRAALEAMACGAPTIICDHRPYNDGPLVCMDMNKAKRFNYSGRGGVAPDKLDRFARETMAFQSPRAYVAEHHDVARIADELLELC